MGAFYRDSLSIALVGLTIGLALPTAAREPMKPGTFDEVGIRVLQGYPAAESAYEANVEDDWHAGFRKAARYVKAAGDEIRYPIIVNYPDWEKGEPTSPTTLQVHLIMDPSGRFPMPREKDIGVVEVPETTVASYAFQGAYTFENQRQALEKIRAFMKEEKIPAIGPPRVVYYSNVDWTMPMFLISEVQVPIPPQEKK